MWEAEGRENGSERVNLFRDGAVGFIDWLDAVICAEFPRRSVFTARSLFQWAIALVPIHFVRTVVGIVISFHLPGLKIHRLNTLVLAVSRIADPVDLIIVTWFTLPVFKSISSRYRPFP